MKSMSPGEAAGRQRCELEEGHAGVPQLMSQAECALPETIRPVQGEVQTHPYNVACFIACSASHMRMHICACTHNRAHTFLCICTGASTDVCTRRYMAQVILSLR